MKIRPAAPADVAQVASLAERYWAFEGIDAFDRPRIESILRSLIETPQQGACWVAEVNGRLGGYLVAVFMLSLEHGGLMAEIDEVFVVEELRALGLGSLLVAAAERGLAERGVTRLQLQLGTDNERARLFYERRGFRRRTGYELLDKPLQAEP